MLSHLYENHPWLIGLFAVTIMCFTGYQAFFKLRDVKHMTDTDIRMSSPVGGSYHQVLTTLNDFASLEAQTLGFRIQADSLPSGGSIDTIEQIGNGQVDIGLVQGNTVFRPEKARKLLELYPEIYLFLSGSDHASVAELLAPFRLNRSKMLHVASIGSGSQVYRDLYDILDYYNVAQDQIFHASLDYQATERRLLDGSLDLALIVGGAKNPTVLSITRQPNVNILAMDDQTRSILSRKKKLFEYTIDAGLFAYQVPAGEIKTLYTPATLVAGGRLDEAVIFDLVNFLVNRKDDLEKILPQLEIKMIDVEDSSIHPAAERRARQDSLNFFQRRQSELKLLLELAGFILSFGSILYQLWTRIFKGKKVILQGT